MNKVALILAGGRGTRTKEKFPGIPKALIPVEGIPMIERIIKQLEDFTIYINVNKIEKSQFEYLHLPLLVESLRCGNAGVIKQFVKELGDRFLVIHCDVLSNINMDKLWKDHSERVSKFGQIGSVTMTVKNIGSGKDFGVVVQEYPNKVTGFTRDRNINCGTYCMDKEVVKYIDENKFQDLDKDLFPKLIDNGLLYTYTHTGAWFDIGIEKFWDK